MKDKWLWQRVFDLNLHTSAVAGHFINCLAFLFMAIMIDCRKVWPTHQFVGAVLFVKCDRLAKRIVPKLYEKLQPNSFLLVFVDQGRHQWHSRHMPK